MLHAPSIEELFPELHDPAARIDRFEEFKKALAAVPTYHGDDVSKALDGVKPAPTQISAPSEQLEQLIADGSPLAKAMSAEAIASIKTELEAAKAVEADILKDITLTSPLSTGLVAYDLEAPAKMVVPRATPLRNRVPRMPGMGTSRRYKRITGISNLGVGGVSNLSPFISDSSTASFGSLTLRRGAKISYASDEAAVIYKQAGLSDMVTWSAEFAGRGYQDIRELSKTSLLWASMHADELALLGARGTDTGYSGAITEPETWVAAVRTAGTGETGNTATLAHVYVRATALSVYGESTSADDDELDVTGLAAVTGKVLDITITDVTGAVGYNVYAGTVSGAATCFYAGTGGYNVVTINFTGAGTGGCPSTGAISSTTVNSTADANGFDGYLAILPDSTKSGYVKRLNAVLSTSGPGSEIQSAFAALYDIPSGGVLADPDEVMMNGFDRKQQSDALIAGSTTPGYRLTITQDEVGGVMLGSLVSGIYNEITGKSVPLTVHPRMPQGNALVLSHTMPFPDSEVGACVEYHLPQDYMAIDWPVIQHTYDVGSYWFGAPVFYAPKWSGYIGGIKKVA